MSIELRDLALYEVKVIKTNRNYKPDPSLSGEMTFSHYSQDEQVIRVLAPKEYEHITPGNPLLKAFIEHRHSTWGQIKIFEIKELEFHGMLRYFGV